LPLLLVCWQKFEVTKALPNAHPYPFKKAISQHLVSFLETQSPFRNPYDKIHHHSDQQSAFQSFNMKAHRIRAGEWEGAECLSSERLAKRTVRY